MRLFLNKLFAMIVVDVIVISILLTIGYTVLAGGLSVICWDIEYFNISAWSSGLLMIARMLAFGTVLIVCYITLRESITGNK